MVSSMQRLEDGTIVLVIKIPKSSVHETKEKITKKALSEVEVRGFRKGKAPDNLARKQLDNTKIYEEVIREIVPQFYVDAVKEHKINPIVQPEIKLSKAKEGEDWEIEARVCEKPKVELGDYKKVIAQARAEAKKDQIWVPGKEEKIKEDPQKTRENELNSILKALLSKVKLQIPDVIIKAEYDKRMARLVDELGKLGLTVDRYLQTKNKSAEDFKSETRREIAETYKLEFILEELSDIEKVTVSEEDFKKVLSSVSDHREKKSLEEQRYYLTSLIRRQKTLDKLLALG